jgi:ABC-2 type transport system permease protein
VALAWVLVRLKLALLRAGLRSAGIRGVVGGLLALALAIAIGSFGGIVFALVRFLSPVHATTATAAAFAGVFVIWILGPIVTATSEGTLEADKLVLFPLAPSQLMPGLLGGAVLGFGGVATILVLGGAFIGMAPVSPLALVTVLAVVLQLAMCVTCSRLVSTAISGAARNRRWRDIALFVGPLLAISINLAFQVGVRSSFNPTAARTGWHPSPWLRTLGAVSRFLPSGMPALAAGYAREGRAALAVLFLLLAAAVLAVALIGWHAVLQRTLTSASVGASRAMEKRGRRPLFPRLVSWLPRDRVGAVAAKDLRLLWRDPRQRASLMGSLFGSIVPLVSLRTLTFHSPAAVLIAAAPAYFIGITTINFYGYDGAAHWTNVAAGDNARADLVGKNVARVIVMTPLVVAAVAVLAWRAGSVTYVGPAIALAIAAAGIAMGIGNVVSVRSPYPMPQSTSNVFSSGNTGRGLALALPVFASMAVGVVVVGPIAAAMILWHGLLARLVTSALAFAVGAVAFAGGLRIAVSWSAPRQAELLAALQRRAAG